MKSQKSSQSAVVISLKLMADFMPIRGDISRPPSADTKLLKVYVNSIFRRYRDETIVDNAHKLEEKSDLSEDEVSIIHTLDLTLQYLSYTKCYLCS